MPYVLALLAAFALGLGPILQQKDTLESPAGENDPRFLAHILRRPVWLAGVGCIVVGWVLQAVALDKGSLIAVQSLIALSLVIALPLTGRKTIAQTPYGSERRRCNQPTDERFDRGMLTTRSPADVAQGVEACHMRFNSKSRSSAPDTTHWSCSSPMDSALTASSPSRSQKLKAHVSASARSWVDSSMLPLRESQISKSMFLV
jgi:hypothetical protein